MEIITKYMLFPIDDAFEIISRSPGFAKDIAKNARFNLKKLAKERKHVSDDKMAEHLTVMGWEMIEPARKSMWRPVEERDWKVQLVYFGEVEQDYGIVRAKTAEAAKKIITGQNCREDETFEMMGKTRKKADWMMCNLIAEEVK
jgi:hypothetical protein